MEEGLCSKLTAVLQAANVYQKATALLRGEVLPELLQPQAPAAYVLKRLRELAGDSDEINLECRWLQMHKANAGLVD